MFLCCLKMLCVSSSYSSVVWKNKSRAKTFLHFNAEPKFCLFLLLQLIKTWHQQDTIQYCMSAWSLVSHSLKLITEVLIAKAYILHSNHLHRLFIVFDPPAAQQSLQSFVLLSLVSTPTQRVHQVHNSSRTQTLLHAFLIPQSMESDTVHLLVKRNRTEDNLIKIAFNPLKITPEWFQFSSCQIKLNNQESNSTPTSFRQ